MISKLFILSSLIILSCYSFAQISKTKVESNSDIIAKSIYIYRNTLHDTSIINRENAIKDLKEKKI